MIRYQQLTYRPGQENESMETMLEKYAAVGWELVAASEHGSHHTEIYHYIRFFLRKDED
jgi:hypothetical protein